MRTANKRAPEGARWKIPDWKPHDPNSEGYEGDDFDAELAKLKTALKTKAEQLGALSDPPDTEPVSVDLMLEPPFLSKGAYTFSGWCSEGIYLKNNAIFFRDEGFTEPLSTTAGKPIPLPDIGDFSDVTVVEILVPKGGFVRKGQSLMTIESEKASMEIPSPCDGYLQEFAVTIGDKVSSGTIIAYISLEITEVKFSPDLSIQGKVICKGDPLCIVSKGQQRMLVNAPFDLFFSTPLVESGLTLDDGAPLAMVKRYVEPNLTLELCRSVMKKLVEHRTKLAEAETWKRQTGSDEKNEIEDLKFRLSNSKIQLNQAVLDIKNLRRLRNKLWIVISVGVLIVIISLTKY
jgi:hypothetical protein